jgi:hypothetical protein
VKEVVDTPTSSSNESISGKGGFVVYKMPQQPTTWQNLLQNGGKSERVEKKKIVNFARTKENIP